MVDGVDEFFAGFFLSKTNHFLSVLSLFIAFRRRIDRLYGVLVIDKIYFLGSTGFRIVEESIISVRKRIVEVVHNLCDSFVTQLQLHETVDVRINAFERFMHLGALCLMLGVTVGSH